MVVSKTPPSSSNWCMRLNKQFQDAPIHAYVPILVEHIVRQQIRSNTSTT